MKTDHIEQLWSEHNRKLESGINLDLEALRHVRFDKVRNSMRKLLLRRGIESAVFLVLIYFLIKFVVANFPVWEFVAAGLVLGIFACIGFAGGLRQIMLISRLDYSGAVTAYLAELEKLKMYSLQTLRLLLLSTPFYFAYLVIGFRTVFGINVFQNTDPKWLIANLVFSIGLIPFSVWVVGKLNYGTKSRWVKNMIRDNGGREIYDSMEFLAELEKYGSE